MTLQTYFQNRMAQIGLANGPFEFTGQNAAGHPVQRVRFQPTDKGDIRIFYYRLDTNPYFYHPTKTDEQRSNVKPYYRDRLQHPMVITDLEGDGKFKLKEKKYNAPKGSHNCPYFTPQIIEAYKAKTKIKLLVLTEGEFKATAACNNEMHVVGISGIQGMYDPDGSKKLHADILDLIKTCQVEKLLLLTDADTLTINYKPDKDLSQRPNNFYSSVKGYREACMHHIETDTDTPLRDVYYGHISIKHNPAGKGLDDLLLQFAHNKAGIIAALNNLTFDNGYFDIYNVTDGLNKISDHFGLTSAEKFYTTYSDFIKDQEFIYKKLTYRWNDEEKQLVKIIHQDIEKFMRIGCDWFKLVMIPNKYGQLDEEIKKWKVSEIARDYLKRFPTFLDDIPKYEAWCNRPAMHTEYKRIHDGCFNLFNPLKYQPEAGAFPKTLMFLRHLFKSIHPQAYNEKGEIVNTPIIGDPFIVALDYLTLMYRSPTQILPVLCLVSPENNTGKTTFLKWLRNIYGSNATIIDNERFKQSFNSHYISKYIIGIDEGFLDVDKRSEKERLKKLATDDRQYLEFKGADVQEIDFYGKIIICSNDADSLMKIDEGEIRWFVVRVHPFEKEMPNLGEGLREEIPAFLHFLQTRQLVHPPEGRAWFNPEHLKTEQLQIIIDKTRNRIDKVVDEFIIDTLRTYGPYGCNEFSIDLKGLSDILNKNGYTKYKIDTIDLKTYLQDKKRMKPEPSGRIRMPVNISENDNMVVYDNSRIARCYVFTAEKWLTETNDDTQPQTAATAITQQTSKQLELEDPFLTDGTKYSKL